MKNMVTIIMPAYNSSSTIENSIDSVLNQSHTDIHLLIIDDGSTDETYSILKKRAEQDSRLEVIRIENSGPANARNVGLDSIVNTDYVMFCDSDDIMDTSFVKKMVNSASSGADVVIGGFTIINTDGSENDYYEPDAQYNTSTFAFALPNLYKANVLNQPWAKLYKYDIVKDIRFPDYKWGEDRPFVFDCLLKAKKISVNSFCGYKYIMRPGESLISGYYEQKPQVCIYIDEKAQKLCEFFGVQDDSCFRYMFTKSIFSCFVTLYSSNCPLSEAQKQKYVSIILNNKYIQSRISPDGGFAVKTIYNAMKTRNPEINLKLAQTANAVNDWAPQLFQKIKHKK